MYNIVFSFNAEKQFSKLDSATQKRVVNVLERIKIRPYEFIKHLSGMPYYRLRIGDYRAIIDIKDKESIILVIELGYRSNIYKIH